MDSSLYNTMKELLTEYKISSSNIYYYGSVTILEKDLATNKNIQTTNDIFLLIQGFKKHPIYNFVDKSGNIIATDRGYGHGVLPTKDYADVLSAEDLSMMNKFEPSNSHSLYYIDNQLDAISKKLRIPKEEILAVSETDEFYRNSKETSENDEKIHLKDDKNDKNSNKNTKTSQEQDSKSKAKIEALEKQSTDLNQKVSETETLGDILGIHESGKLVAVYSDSIENGTKNNTRFTFLIKDADGNYSEIPNIEQAGGINPNTDVAQSNENGDNVKKEDVNSIYRIKGPGNIEYLLTANIGPYGTIELGIGQRDKTQGIDESDLVTTPLKTSSTYYTNRQTRESINSSRHGTKQATERSREADTHDGESCNLTKDEVDGNTNTGHQHISTSEYSQSIADIIINNDDEIDGVGDHLTITNVYNRSDIQKIVKSVHEENHELSDEELIKVATDIIKSKAAEQLLYGHIRGSRSYDNVS